MLKDDENQNFSDIEYNRKLAREEGREEVREEGKKHLLQTAKNLLKMGLSVADIAKATVLSVDQILAMTI